MQTLVAIGGGIKWKNPVILQEFIQRAGGAKAHIVILPQASREEDTGKFYQNEFKKLGVKNPIALEFTQRINAEHASHIKAIRNATGIFFGGGTQMRIAALLGGTKLEDEILQAYHRGAVVSGTSAGTAILSTLMLAYGKPGATPREGMAQFSPGLGFTTKIIFDQHFRERDRFGRLAYAVSMHPGMLGVGVDENTAAIVTNDSLITVAGSGAVTIVDGKELVDTDTPEITSGSKPVSISGLKVHILTHGCSFDIKKRKATLVKKFSSDD